jgi:hypothetical protein
MVSPDEGADNQGDTMRRFWIGLVIAGLLPAAAGAITAGEKCEADKLKTAGKYTFCRMKADAKAIKTSSAPDYTKCDEKYGDKWGRVESKAGGTCPVTGDEAAVQTQANDCTDGLAATIGGNPPAGCVGDLVTCEDDLTTCDGDLTTCDTNLTTCDGDLTVCDSDLTTCETDLVAAELCGNGAIDGGEDCDLGTLNGATCVSESFAGGVLSCGDGCVFDTSGCWAARFVDNADGTITDNVSGLMWEKKTELGGGSSTCPGGATCGNPHDVDNRYYWSGTCTVATSKRCQPTSAASALCTASVEGDPDGCSECTGGDGTCNRSETTWTFVADLNSASFAGHTDWRAPKLQELQAIIDYADAAPPAVDVAFQGASCGVACTDITSAACSCTQSTSYWAATTYAPGPIGAWRVGFSDGYVTATNKPDFNLYVRAVRGGS